MKPNVYKWHQQLKRFPPAQLIYILYRRLIEHGARATYLWVQDKVILRTRGASLPTVSRVQPGLYVGGQHNARGLARLREAGIEAVVNLREESDDAERGVAPEHYLWLPTTDDYAISHEHLERGVDFIAAQIAAGRSVYVHCAAGVGRAPMMAAAYLVAQGMSLAEAWETVRQGRPFIRPTPPQLEAIEGFAAYLSGDDGGR